METVALSLIVQVAVTALSLLVAYFVIRAAVVSALRHSRREGWTEDHMPEKATWLTERQRDELRRLADARS